MAPPEIIEQLLTVIRHGRIDNSYKMVWAKAIVDLSDEDPDRKAIPLSEIADKVIGYYWNLHIFFDPDGRTLRQSSNSSKPPKILQHVLGYIASYKSLKGEKFKPCFYEQLEEGDKKKIAIQPAVIASILKENVRHRFLKYSGAEYAFYDYRSDVNQLIFEVSACEQLAQYQGVLRDSIHYRWTQILEDFNKATPRIAAKVAIRRSGPRTEGSLKKYHEWLKIENPNLICSYCEKPIEKDDLSVDHLIPYSFLFSNDIWNLSFTHSHCNSSKNNTPPTKHAIDMQDKRNQNLYNLVSSKYPELFDKKVFKELSFALQENLLRKMSQIYQH
ncbi:MAG: hypothetical protein DRQ47_10570 [Gammaproteobacteria bacterium]|nr:MAG: hypothetical protein DRQ47_10570 [Gammaproteobacteria bacterium]